MESDFGKRISGIKLTIRTIIGRFRSSTSTSFQLRNRSTHIERESPSHLVLEAAVQNEFLSKSRTEQNESGIDNLLF